jgi:hypothetical protein
MPLHWTIGLGSAGSAATTTAAVIDHVSGPATTDADAARAVAMPARRSAAPGEPGPLLQSGGEAHAVHAAAAATPAGLSAAIAALPLASTLARLDTQYPSVTARIPNRFDFLEGESGNSIADGGNDMYDVGNLLSTDRGSSLPYSNGVITPSPAFGGAYYTRKLPGLWVLAADMANVSWFGINGNLGANGAGNVDLATLEVVRGTSRFRGYVKRVFNAGDPSVNHLVIIPTTAGVLHSVSGSTDSDFDQLSGLNAVPRLYDLLFARTGGGYVPDSTMLSIMTAFLDIVEPNSTWLDVTPLSGTVAAHGEVAVQVQFNSIGVPLGSYGASIEVISDDPLHPLVSVPVTLTVATAGASLAGVRPAESVRLALQGMLPNPPVSELVVSFSLPDAQSATLELIDLAGRRVRSLDVGTMGPGQHTASFGRSGPLASGVYMVRLLHGGRALVSKCVVMK